MGAVLRWYFAPVPQLTNRERRWHTFWLYTFPLAAALHVVVLVECALLGARTLALVNVGCALIYVVAGLAYRTGRTRLGLWIVTLEVAAHAVFAVQQIGLASGIHQALLLIALWVAAPSTRAEKLGRLATGIAAAVATNMLGPPAVVLSPTMLHAISAQVSVLLLIVIAFVLTLLSDTADHLEAELAQERARSEALLKRELGHQVAERSRALGGVLASVDAPLPVRVLTAGEQFGERYKVIRALGSGAMGAVYEVERLTDAQQLALKVVMRRASGADAARFAREAEIGARVQHPNVVSIVDVGVAPHGAPFLVMELIRGGSLEERRERFGRPAWGLPILWQVAQGLAALHEAGVVHRDLKPANILLAGSDDAPVAKISDFGISRFGEQAADPFAATVNSTAAKAQRLTGTGAFIGTPFYMAPEAARGGREVGTPADVFAFGIVAHEVLTGRAPFATPPVLLAMAGQPIAATPIDKRVVGDVVRELLVASLAPEPGGRPRMRDLVAALSK